MWFKIMSFHNFIQSFRYKNVLKRLCTSVSSVREVMRFTQAIQLLRKSGKINRTPVLLVRQLNRLDYTRSVSFHKLLYCLLSSLEYQYIWPYNIACLQKYSITVMADILKDQRKLDSLEQIHSEQYKLHLFC